MKRFFRQRLAQFIGLTIIAVVAITACVVLHTRPAAALAGSDFSAGRVIDDIIFTNKDAMSVNDIQNFLYNKVPACDTWGVQSSTHWNAGANRYYTNGEWGHINGNDAPYTCLRDYKENPTTHANNYRNPDAQIAGSLTAAQIIADAAQRYTINPEVILTTLQKEEGLVTDNWPWSIQYRSAMGYGCPDSAACDNDYYGFYNQVENAAWQFRQYLDHPNNYNYAVGNSFVKYNPNSSCGGSVINIQTQSTAALYIYTPYQPNGAAMAHVSDSSSGGTGDSCSSYGVRNFWWYFSSWFGSTVSSGYTWQYMTQNAYTDQTKATAANLSSTIGGQRYYLTLTVKNVGMVTWRKNSTNLGTSQPKDRPSAFYDSTWPSWNRAGTLKEDTVAPGQTGTFEFWVTIPNNPGDFREYFNLVTEGVTWMNDMGLYWSFHVNPQQFIWQWVNQNAYTDQTKATPVDMSNVAPGKRYYLTLTAKNIGNMTWNKNLLNIATNGPKNRGSAFYDNTWMSPSRPATMNESSVAPGDNATFSFWVTSPISQTSGTYREYFNLVDEYVAWLNDPGLQWQFSVNAAQYNWQNLGQGIYTDQTKSTPVGPSTLQAGHRYYLSVQMRNVGNMTWQQNFVNLGTTGPLDRHSAFYDSTWPKVNRAATIAESSVTPGNTATFGFWITAPANPGTYREYFDPVADGISWFIDYGLYWELTVH